MFNFAFSFAYKAIQGVSIELKSSILITYTSSFVLGKLFHRKNTIKSRFFLITPLYYKISQKMRHYKSWRALIVCLLTWINSLPKNIFSNKIATNVAINMLRKPPFFILLDFQSFQWNVLAKNQMFQKNKIFS